MIFEWHWMIRFLRNFLHTFILMLYFHFRYSFILLKLNASSGQGSWIQCVLNDQSVFLDPKETWMMTRGWEVQEIPSLQVRSMCTTGSRCGLWCKQSCLWSFPATHSESLPSWRTGVSMLSIFSTCVKLFWAIYPMYLINRSTWCE